MSNNQPSVLQAAIDVLNAESLTGKVAAAGHAVEILGMAAAIDDLAPNSIPVRPKRPNAPALVRPADVPRRRFGSLEGRASLLHAVAHIEVNAIDLAFDMAARFSSEIGHMGLDQHAFVTDWFGVGSDEARHFDLLNHRLGALGYTYGDFPAHDGLWEVAEKTASNLLARLAVAPLILEARGLDVTPGMVRRLQDAGDSESAAVLETIYHDEIRHVACGKRWFHAICTVKDVDPAATFHLLKDRWFTGDLRPPFNYKARDEAGLLREFYEPK